MSSPQQLKNKLKSFGVEIPVVDGKESLDKNVLTSLKDKHPSIPLLLEHRKLRKLFSAFFDPLPQLTDNDGRIRPHFHNTGTRTGRLSCSEPNIQQLPKAVCAVCGHGKVTKDDECKKCGAYVIQVRKCFVAPEGKTLITCDYSGQEIRVLAHISQDPTMVDALLKGKDLHLTTANQFYNLGISEEALALSRSCLNFSLFSSNHLKKTRKSLSKSEIGLRSSTLALPTVKGRTGSRRTLRLVKKTHKESWISISRASRKLRRLLRNAVEM
jgi:hypothetical protein